MIKLLLEDVYVEGIPSAVATLCPGSHRCYNGDHRAMQDPEHSRRVLLTIFRICCGRVLALGAEVGDHEGGEGAPADAAGGWLQLLHGGLARDDGFCSLRSREGRLSGFRLLLLKLAVSFFCSFHCRFCLLSLPV